MSSSPSCRSSTSQLKDPLSKEDQQPPNLPGWNPVQRSVNPKYLVVVGICTHLGCIPKYRPQLNAADLPAGWPGGFFCPCHGSRYDLSARVMDGSPAPLNLPVPPHYYKDATTLVAGQLADGSQVELGAGYLVTAGSACCRSALHFGARRRQRAGDRCGGLA